MNQIVPFMVLSSVFPNCWIELFHHDSTSLKRKFHESQLDFSQFSQNRHDVWGDVENFREFLQSFDYSSYSELFYRESAVLQELNSLFLPEGTYTLSLKECYGGFDEVIALVIVEQNTVYHK
jgi:hypothetical protein